MQKKKENKKRQLKNVVGLQNFWLLYETYKNKEKIFIYTNDGSAAPVTIQFVFIKNLSIYYMAIYRN